MTTQSTHARMLAPALMACLLALIAAALYATRLQDAPVYLASDEIKFALQARSVAATGRALNGQFLPLYFSEPGFSAGRDPMSIYVTALLLRFRPFTESTIRLPTAAIAVLDVVLIFFVALRMFRRNLLAIVAAAALALTPGHFIYGRVAVDVLYPLPFLLGWLLCLVEFLERRRPWALFTATLLLGIGIYSYIAFMVMAPVYLILTVFAIGKRSGRDVYLVAAAGFAIPLVLLVRWCFQHPTQYNELVGAYRLYDSHLNPLQGVKDLTSYFSISVRSGIFWDFFNPSFLFFSGDSSVMNSTRLAGVFLWPVLFFLVVGLRRAVVRKSPLDIVLLAGLLTSPLAATLLAEVALRRVLVMLPFVILIATSGFEVMLTARRRVWQLAAVALVLIGCAQFRSFYIDYMGDYRVRSSTWFGGNVRDAMLGVMQRPAGSPDARIYVTDSIPFGQAYWEFYSIVARRQDLVPTWVNLKQFDVRGVLPPALLVTDAAAVPDGLLQSGGWKKTRLISEPNGIPSFAIYEK